MTAYNPAEVERLIAEAREDDARMIPAPWEWNSRSHRLEGAYEEQPDAEVDDPGIRHCIIETDGGHYPPGAIVGTAIARTRNNLHALADQLEAARLEIERLQHANASLIPGAMLTTTEMECLRVERDGARADVERLTETARTACENWMSACKQRDEARSEIERLRTALPEIGKQLDDATLDCGCARFVTDAIADRVSAQLTAPAAPHVNATLATIGPLMTQAEAEQLRAERAAEREDGDGAAACRNCGSRAGCHCWEHAQELLRAERDRATVWETKCDDARARVAALESDLAESEEQRDVYRDRAQQLASQIATLEAADPSKDMP